MKSTLYCEYGSPVDKIKSYLSIYLIRCVRNDLVKHSSSLAKRKCSPVMQSLSPGTVSSDMYSH